MVEEILQKQFTERTESKKDINDHVQFRIKKNVKKLFSIHAVLVHEGNIF